MIWDEESLHYAMVRHQNTNILVERTTKQCLLLKCKYYDVILFNTEEMHKEYGDHVMATALSTSSVASRWFQQFSRAFIFYLLMIISYELGGGGERVQNYN